MAWFRKYGLFLLLAVLGLGTLAAFLSGSAARGFHAVCEAAAARRADHRNPCTGEILNRVLLRADAAADGLAGSALALEYRHVFSSSNEAFYESVRVEWAPFRPGRFEIGTRGAPVVRYAAGILGQPKLRCVNVVKRGSVDVKEGADGVEARLDLFLNCQITKEVGASEFHDLGTYAELKRVPGQPL